MNLRELIAGTRQVKTNMWKPDKDFRSRNFGQIIDLDVKGRYNAHFKTLTVTMYIKSDEQKQRNISHGLGATVIATHTVAITFKNIVQHTVDVQAMSSEYNERNPETPITSVQDIINKMKESQPDLVPIEVTPEYITFRTKIDLSTECRVKCTCAHFYYTFAYYCAQADAYIGDAVAPYKAKRKIKGRVRFRNANGTPGLCKHLQLLVTHILKTDNGINGNIEYSNARIGIPSSIRSLIKPNQKPSNANKVLEAYEEGDNVKDKNNLIKLAIRELKNFNSAVRQQKSENYNIPDKSEIDNNGRY